MERDGKKDRKWELCWVQMATWLKSTLKKLFFFTYHGVVIYIGTGLSCAAFSYNLYPFIDKGVKLVKCSRMAAASIVNCTSINLKIQSPKNRYTRARSKEVKHVSLCFLASPAKGRLSGIRLCKVDGTL